MVITGGDKWKKHLQKLAQKVKVRAGVLEGATNGDGEDVATYAAMNEFGTSKIPSRPFMRQTRAVHGQEWVNKVKTGILNGMPPEEALHQIGRVMADDIQATIMSNMQPPNSKKWAEYKNKHEKLRSGAMRAGTLINTGALVGSIKWDFGNDEFA